MTALHASLRRRSKFHGRLSVRPLTGVPCRCGAIVCRHQPSHADLSDDGSRDRLAPVRSLACRQPARCVSAPPVSSIVPQLAHSATPIRAAPFARYRTNFVVCCRSRSSKAGCDRRVAGHRSRDDGSQLMAGCAQRLASADIGPGYMSRKVDSL